jgi:hypothetical protein
MPRAALGSAGSRRSCARRHAHPAYFSPFFRSRKKLESEFGLANVGHNFCKRRLVPHLLRMAHNFVVAFSMSALAAVLCTAIFFGTSTTVTPSLLSLSTASSDEYSSHDIPVPRPISLLPAISSERALNTLPLWHGRTDEDVMAHPPPPFFALSPFAHGAGSLRSTSQFLSNSKMAAGAGPKDGYETMKAQYDAQERRLRRIEKRAVYKIQRASLDVSHSAAAAVSTERRAPVSERQEIRRAFRQSPPSIVAQGSLRAGRHAHSRAVFVHDAAFYKAANSKIGIAKFDANLASTIQSRSPRLAHDLLHISASIMRRLRPRQRAAAPRPTATLMSQAHRPSVVAVPVTSLQPMLPASLRHKLLPYDTTFYQAANSRAGIAKFDSQLASEIQERRPGLSQDLKRISAAILSAPLSSLKPLLPAAASVDSQSAAPQSSLSSSDDGLGSLTPLAHKSNKQDVQVERTVSFEHLHHPEDYKRIFQEHAVPKAHFPQQEEAWIHFAASGASFGGETKEQREAVKKVKSGGRTR